MSATLLPDVLPVHRDGGPPLCVRLGAGDPVVINVCGELSIGTGDPAAVAEPSDTFYLGRWSSAVCGSRWGRVGRPPGWRMSVSGSRVMVVDGEHGAL
jgi:hypothetical protein